MKRIIALLLIALTTSTALAAENLNTRIAVRELPDCKLVGTWQYPCHMYYIKDNKSGREYIMFEKWEHGMTSIEITPRTTTK